MKPAYYNERDKYCAQWLRNLIAAGHIAPGDVDERDIQDVRPDDLRGYNQCHFFAGIGVWSYALRLAGWPDDRPVWTGSCPCQPFSEAGKGAGFADERHLWPAFFHLIREHRPAKLFGEQVASKDADPWIDLIQDDLEGLGYTVGAVPFPAAGIGSPNRRDRLYWMADANNKRLESGRRHAGKSHQTGRRRNGYAGGSALGSLAQSSSERLEGLGLHVQPGQQESTSVETRRSSKVIVLADSMRKGSLPSAHSGLHSGEASPGSRHGELERFRAVGDRGPTNGYWRDADWLFCTDGKWRPVEPGTFPLAHGASARVGRLRAYGNAINAQQAAEFIMAFESAGK